MAATSGMICRTAVSVRTGTMMTGNPVETTRTGKRVPEITALVMPKARAIANNASGSSMTSRNCGLRLRHDHALDHTIAGVDVDREQAEITFLEHPRDRPPKRETVQGGQHKKRSD